MENSLSKEATDWREGRRFTHGDSSPHATSPRSGRRRDAIQFSHESADRPKKNGRVAYIQIAQAVLRCVADQRKGKPAARRGRKTHGPL
jgi:hypothetical protein